ncbi:MAG TPA: type I 3-dehydroquinate dehydratase, partial [Nitrososphaerales archaeon]|nr:type I 3-dehydroquinate dehydratase [Nitrososphaerales archaeon]
ETGSISRILSPMLGAPFIYCSFGNKAIAPGQISINTLQEIYSNFS